MIKVSYEPTDFLVSRLLGSRNKMTQSEGEIRQITIRLEEPVMKRIEKMVEKTEGWSRNVVIQTLLEGGLALVEHSIAWHEERDEALYGGEK